MKQELFLSVNVKFKCIDLIRKGSVRLKHEIELAKILQTHEENDFATEQVRLDLVNKIYKAADSLPPRMKEIFELSYKQGLKPSEIAQQTGSSVQTIKNQRVKAIALLKKIFQNKPLILAMLLLMEWDTGNIF